jgi:Spy/CpxP family protein refolding chaperone
MTKSSSMRCLLFVSLGLLVSLFAQAQTGTEAPAGAVSVANKIADHMRDSLHLSAAQRDQIFDINIQLFLEKQQARAASTNRDSVSRLIQRIENKRDSLYIQVLSKEQNYNYQLKKRNLVSYN